MKLSIARVLELLSHINGGNKETTLANIEDMQAATNSTTRDLLETLNDLSWVVTANQPIFNTLGDIQKTWEAGENAPYKLCEGLTKVYTRAIDLFHNELNPDEVIFSYKLVMFLEITSMRKCPVGIATAICALARTARQFSRLVEMQYLFFLCGYLIKKPQPARDGHGISTPWPWRVVASNWFLFELTRTVTKPKSMDGRSNNKGYVLQHRDTSSKFYDVEPPAVPINWDYVRYYNLFRDFGPLMKNIGKQAFDNFAPTWKPKTVEIGKLTKCRDEKNLRFLAITRKSFESNQRPAMATSALMLAYGDSTCNEATMCAFLFIIEALCEWQTSEPIYELVDIAPRNKSDPFWALSLPLQPVGRIRYDKFWDDFLWLDIRPIMEFIWDVLQAESLEDMQNSQWPLLGLFQRFFEHVSPPESTCPATGCV